MININNMGKNYTEQEWENIKLFYHNHDNITLGKICELYEITRWELYIHGIEKRLNKKIEKTPRPEPRIYSKEEIDTITNYYINNKVSHNDIIEKYKVTRSFCVKYLKGVSNIFFKKLTEEEWDNIIDEYKNTDITQKQVSIKYGVSSNDCEDKLNGLKPRTAVFKTGFNRNGFTTNGKWTLYDKTKEDRVYEWVCDSCGTIVKKLPAKISQYSCSCVKEKRKIERLEKQKLLIDTKNYNRILNEEELVKKRINKEKLKEEKRGKKRERLNNMINKKFHSLLIIGLGDRKRHLKYRCDCGNEGEILINSINKTRSCGCFRNDTRHGESKTRTYESWRAMRRRCYDPNFLRYELYGGRGITVCERWLNSYENFKEDMGERPEGKTIDRTNVHGHYELGNCTWATPKEQSNNQQRHVKNPE